jgi:hypothetical protein
MMRGADERDGRRRFEVSMSLAAAGLKMIIYIFLNEQNQPFTYTHRRYARPNPESVV